ncbi:MAG: rhomboid family intramembrane serine protease [Bacteroidales bacterium]|nr:rhomboid family intramembrane serine protease [Bacteroidales bacterium]
MGYLDDSRFGSFWYRIPQVTRNVVAINILFFIATLINEDFMYRVFSLYYFKSPFFHSWQILTHMFMHGGFWHLFFNMYTLLMFGTALENAIGSRKFLVFYFIAGLGAVALHMGVQGIQLSAALSADNLSGVQSVLYTPTVGASGAIYGILIGYAMMYPDSVLTLLFPPISLKAKWFVLIFAAIELLTGVTGTMEGIAHFAHLGGMLFGWLLMLWWKKTGRIYERDNWI